MPMYAHYNIPAMGLAGFPPLVDDTARILILGSFPSSASLKCGMYYGNLRNHFWNILSRILKVAVPTSIDEKQALLKEAHLALWDLVGTCERTGSLDQNIIKPVLHDIAGFVEAHPAIERILLNGTLATELFYRRIVQHKGPIPPIGSIWIWEGPQKRTISVYRLPSTSPVPTKHFKRLEDKLPLWEGALQ